MYLHMYYVHVHIFTCATVNKTVHKASASTSELASSCMYCHHLVQLTSLHLNAGYSDIVKTVTTFFLLSLSCSLCYFYCFLESIFFLSHLSVSLSFFLSPFFSCTYISVFLYSTSVHSSFLLPTFFHSLFPSFSFLLCSFPHVHTHMYITHRYKELTSLLHNDALLYPLRNTAFLGVWKYKTSPSGEIT